MLWIRDPVPFWLLDPGSGMSKKSGSGSGINNPDHISERLETIFELNYLNSLMWIRDPGWKKFGSGINIPDPQHWKFLCWGKSHHIYLFSNFQIESLGSRSGKTSKKIVIDECGEVAAWTPPNILPTHTFLHETIHTGSITAEVWRKEGCSGNFFSCLEQETFLKRQIFRVTERSR